MIIVDLKAQGLKKAQNVIKYAQKLGSVLGGVSLRGNKRGEGNDKLDNAQVEEYLRKGGRDFTTPNKQVLDGIGDVVAKEFGTALHKAAKRKSVMGDPKKQATAAAGVSLRRAMEYWMQWVDDNMDNQRAAKGGLPKVDEEYAKRRLRKYGVPETIVGKATGQLLDNYADRRAIKLERKK